MTVGETAHPSGLRRLSRPLLFILPLLAPLYGLGQRGLFESDEGRYAAVALAMLESGDQWIPRFDPDTPHLSKPPLLYWTIAASIAIFGKSEWTVRLPSVLGFWLGCLGVALAARALSIRPWAAVWIFASALPVAVAAEIVSTDMLLTGLLAAAVGSWLSSLVSPKPLLWRFLAGIAFGLAFLCKGPPALLPLIAMAAWRKREGLSVPLLGAIGWLAFAASALPWYLVVMMKIPDVGAIGSAMNSSPASSAPSMIVTPGGTASSKPMGVCWRSVCCLGCGCCCRGVLARTGRSRPRLGSCAGGFGFLWRSFVFRARGFRSTCSRSSRRRR